MLPADILERRTRRATMWMFQNPSRPRSTGLRIMGEISIEMITVYVRYFNCVRVRITIYREDPYYLTLGKFRFKFEVQMASIHVL